MRTFSENWARVARLYTTVIHELPLYKGDASISYNKRITSPVDSSVIICFRTSSMQGHRKPIVCMEQSPPEKSDLLAGDAN